MKYSESVRQFVKIQINNKTIIERSVAKYFEETLSHYSFICYFLVNVCLFDWVPY